MRRGRGELTLTLQRKGGLTPRKMGHPRKLRVSVRTVTGQGLVVNFRRKVHRGLGWVEGTNVRRGGLRASNRGKPLGGEEPQKAAIQQEVQLGGMALSKTTPPGHGGNGEKCSDFLLRLPCDFPPGRPLVKPNQDQGLCDAAVAVSPPGKRGDRVWGDGPRENGFQSPRLLKVCVRMNASWWR